MSVERERDPASAHIRARRSSTRAGRCAKASESSMVSSFLSSPMSSRAKKRCVTSPGRTGTRRRCRGQASEGHIRCGVRHGGAGTGPHPVGPPQFPRRCTARRFRGEVVVAGPRRARRVSRTVLSQFAFLAQLRRTGVAGGGARVLARHAWRSLHAAASGKCAERLVAFHSATSSSAVR